MKKTLLLPLLVLAAALVAKANPPPTPVGTAELVFGLGDLTGKDGLTAIPDGSLLQVIASLDGNPFAPPVSNDYLGDSSDEDLLWEGAFDSSTTGVPGEMLLDLPNINLYSLPTYLEAGDHIIVRWFPALSGTSIPASPGPTAYGQYGFPQDSSWVVPAAGGAAEFDLITESAGGELPNGAGAAILTVPEGAAGALNAVWLAAGLGLGWVARRRPARA